MSGGSTEAVARSSWSVILFTGFNCVFDPSTARHVLHDMLRYPPLFSASSGLERTHPFTHKSRGITAHTGVEFGSREAAKISSNIGTYPLPSTSATPDPSGCRVVPLLINTISFVYHLCPFVGSTLLVGSCIVCSISPRLERVCSFFS
jgi:hypothetical protein